MKIATIVVWAFVCFNAFAMLFAVYGGRPAMEGQAGYFGLFVGGPIGAVVGSVLAILLWKWAAGNERTQKWLFGGPLAAAVAVVVGVNMYESISESIRTWGRLDGDGRPFDLGFQVRLPADAAWPGGAKFGIQLFSDKESPPCDIYDAPHGFTRERDRFVISGHCKLHYVTSPRTLAVKIGGASTQLHVLKVKSTPTSGAYSEWFPVDEVQDATSGQRRPPRPEEMLEFRYGAK